MVTSQGVPLPTPSPPPPKKKQQKQQQQKTTTTNKQTKKKKKKKKQKKNKKIKKNNKKNKVQRNKNRELSLRILPRRTRLLTSLHREKARKAWPTATIHSEVFDSIISSSFTDVQGLHN